MRGVHIYAWLAFHLKQYGLAYDILDSGYYTAGGILTDNLKLAILGMYYGVKFTVPNYHLWPVI